MAVEPLVPDADGCPVWRIEVACSSGTYIRTLAADIGHALGGGAHLRSLRRTAVGTFRVEDGAANEQLTSDRLITPAAGMGHLGAVTVDATLVGLIANGRVLPRQVVGVNGDGPWRVLDEHGALLAIYEAHRDDTAKPSVVLPPVTQRALDV